jgi:2-methylcitrate dehydratase PrpD
MVMGLTRQLGEFVSELNSDRLPKDVLDIVATAFTDCIGVMLAGREEPCVRIVKAQFLAKAGSGSSSVLLSNLRVDAATAATINGTAAHALDYDDVALRGHPSAVLVSAILAEAEDSGASGAEMVAAYVAGYETWAEIGRRIPKPLHVNGFHPTAIFGTLGAAAACARLRGLTPEKAANAIAMAGSQASGLTVNFGSDTKPFHVGSAAAAGLMCARLAEAGMTAASDGLENPAGLLAVYGAKPDVLSDPADELGNRWRIEESGVSIKRYPVCYGIHRVVDAIIEMRQAGEIKSADIDNIHIRMGEIQKRMLRVDYPTTPLEAKFSARFCAAAAAIRGNVGFAELQDVFIRSRELQDLMSKITFETVPEIDPAFSNYAPYDQVHVTMRSGERVDSSQVKRSKGHADAPLSASELHVKFDDCTRTTLTRSGQTFLFDRLQSLFHLRSTAELWVVVNSSISLHQEGTGE